MADPIAFIDVPAQYKRLKAPIDARIRAVLDHGQFIMGPEVAELEDRLARFVGVRHAVGVSDGTTALLIALMALDIGPGDEIITTPFTFVATAETVSLLRAKPVFVDVDERTGNIDPARIEAAITPRTRAILPVDLYGQCADADAIQAIASRHGLAVIEDAAQSFGATWKGRRAGSLATIACTSFFPSKPLGCFGDGGACLTDDDTLAARMARIRVHGQSSRYVHSEVGLNGRLDTLQAAILLAKLDAFEPEIRSRQAIAARYCSLIDTAGLTKAGIHVPWVDPRGTSVFAQFTVRVQQRDRVVEALKVDGIPTAVHYPVCLHHQPMYQKTGEYAGQSFPVAEALAREVLSLPMHPDLDEGTQERIVHGLARAIRQVNTSADHRSDENGAVKA